MEPEEICGRICLWFHLGMGVAVCFWLKTNQDFNVKVDLVSRALLWRVERRPLAPSGLWTSSLVTEVKQEGLEPIHCEDAGSEERALDLCDLRAPTLALGAIISGTHNLNSNNSSNDSYNNHQELPLFLVLAWTISTWPLPMDMYRGARFPGSHSKGLLNGLSIPDTSLLLTCWMQEVMLNSSCLSSLIYKIWIIMCSAHSFKTKVLSKQCTGC